MNNFMFENRTKAYFGKGCVKEYLGMLVSGYGNNVMLAYGGGSIQKNGIYKEVVDILKVTGKTIIDFPGIMPNPTYKKVIEGAKLVKEKKIDLILGVGGGSVMDCCKAISLVAATKEDAWEHYLGHSGNIDFDTVPLGLIVTVSGTGSEMNGGAVITNEDARVKTGKDYMECNARFALLDPNYTLSVPKLQMISGAFDTLSHIMEIYFSEPDENNVSDDISEALMKNVIANLREAIQNPQDYNARSNLMWDATMAENRIIKLGKKTDFECHMMEHQLGAYTDCNHGMGLAVLHPAYYRHIYKDGIEKFAQFATNVWGISSEGKIKEELAFAGVTAMTDFIKEIGLPSTLHELNISDRALLKEVADSCVLLTGGYRQLTHEEIYEIFIECI